jgi:hypothetical protein
LATFRERFSSRREVSLLFAACVFPIHVWSILRLLSEVPAWMFRTNTWELIGAVAYAHAIALLESTMVLLSLIPQQLCFPHGSLENDLWLKAPCWLL